MSDETSVCPSCEGRGWVPLTDEGGLPVKCGKCDGTGKVKQEGGITTTETQPVLKEEPVPPMRWQGVIEVGKLRKFFTVIHRLVDEVAVYIQEDGLYCKGVDPAHVAMVEANLARTEFTHFEVDRAERLFIDADAMLNMMKRIPGTRSEVTMTATQIGPSQYVIKLEWEDHGDQCIRAKNGPDGIGIPEVRIPDLKLPVEFEMDRFKLGSIIASADDISDTLTMTFRDDAMTFCAKSDVERYTRKVRVDNRKDGENKVRGNYPMDYLTNMVAGLMNVDRLTVMFGSDYPVSFTGEKDGLKVRYILAPRIMSD